MVHPAGRTYLGVPGHLLAWAIFVLGLAVFGYFIFRRYRLLRLGQSDPRFGSAGRRIRDLVTYGFVQKRQPRYLWAGVIHLLIFWGFMVLGLRSIDLVTQGLGLPFLGRLLGGTLGGFYNSLKDLFELIVLVTCAWAMLRRAIARPERYKGSHHFEAYFVLSLIAGLMVTDMFYEAGLRTAAGAEGHPAGWLPATGLAALVLGGAGRGVQEAVMVASYWVHFAALFFFLLYLPVSKHFHVITALPNVYLRKLTRGAVKPARWGVEDLEQLESLGVGKVEDFTWKHMLDFFTCTECGRCSDHCPANAVGRPLSPKMVLIHLRDHAYGKVPVFPGKKKEEDKGAMVGGVVGEDEIWSCTTCSACEEECPVFIEYVDKFIDMRRHLVENSRNPKGFNQILMHVEKTGNPFGKPPAKRADWVEETSPGPVKILKKGDEVDVLYFVDSYASFDPRSQKIAGCIAKGLNAAGADFGILGPKEKDSGHQVRRLGEEGLFQLLLEENREALGQCRFRRVVTTDPHALNTLKNDYPIDMKVEHYSSFFQEAVERGRLKPAKPVPEGRVYTYHDPCYLGRYNGVYDAPRKLLRSLPGMNLVEMKRCRDRSFCCGGGDVALWHDIEKEEMRMGEKRIRMAAEAGANVIVTACPFCLIHFEDGIKTLGLEEKMETVDLMELFVSTLGEE